MKSAPTPAARPPEPAGALRYPWSEPPAFGGALEVAPGVRWIRLPLPFALDHINVWLIADGEGWALVDTGVGVDEVRSLWEDRLDALLDGRPLSRVLVTHHHPDHLGQAGWLAQRCAVELSMSAPELAAARRVLDGAAAADVAAIRAHYARHGIDEFERLAPVEAGHGYRRIVSPLPPRVTTVADGEALTIGAHTWRAILTGGHAPGHMSLHCPALGLLISGDHVLPAITANVSLRPEHPEADPLGAYLESFARFDGCSDDTLVLPSHGRPFIGLRERIARIRAHHEAMLAHIAAMCDAPYTAGALLPRIYPGELDALNFMLALGEVLAHLRYLELRGVLERRCNAGRAEFIRPMRLRSPPQTA